MGVVVISAIALYWPGLGSGFWFDDLHVIQENRNLRIDCLCFDQLRAAAYSYVDGTRMVSMLSFALNDFFFGPSAVAFKLVNVAIHCLVAIALFILSKVTISAFSKSADSPLFESRQAVRWIPLVTVAMWTVHPINLSPVLYISQRMAMLSALFTSIGLICYVLARQRSMDGRRGSIPLFAGVLVAALLAYLSKENGVLVFGYILVLELTIFGFRGRSGRIDRRFVFAASAMVVVPLGIVLYDLVTGGHIVVGGYESRPFSLTERALTETRALWFYIKLILVPDITQYGLWHDDFSLSTGLLEPPTTVVALLGLVALFVPSLIWHKKYPILALGVLWFFVSHSLESTVFPLELVHEHRNYLAGYGLLLAVNTVVLQLIPIRRLIKIAGITVLFLSLAINTFARTKQWSSPLSVAVTEASNHPISARAQRQLGEAHVALASQGYAEAIPEAIESFQRARDLDPYSIISKVWLALTSQYFNTPYVSDWLPSAADKLRNYPHRVDSILALQRLYECIKNQLCKFPEEDIEPLIRAAEDGGDARALSIVGFYRANVQGDFRRAEEAFLRAMEKDPKDAAHRINYVSLLIAMNRMDEAQQYLDELLALGDSRVHLHEERIDEFKRRLGKRSLQ
jgi:tetratricopeptide (TPR) repeat protein